MAWLSFRPTAAWRQTGWASHKAWLAHHPNPHPVFLIKTITIHHVMVDPLHSVDLGVTAHVVGNALYYLISTDIYPVKGAADKVTAALWVEIEAVFKAQEYFKGKSVITSLTIGMFLDPKSMSNKFPSLRHMKAAESKHLAHAVLHVFRGYARADVEADVRLLESVLRQHRLKLGHVFGRTWCTDRTRCN
jgi:hypothetical protein